MRNVTVLALAMLAVAACGAAAHTMFEEPPVMVHPIVAHPLAGPRNITAIYMCNTSSCTTNCQSATLQQDVCSYVPVAYSYIIYSCINGGAQVQLQIFGPLKFACNPKNPLHITKTFDTNKCVLPNKAGGYTVYHCPRQ